MPLDASVIGRSYPPSRPYEVGREKIREFADAIGDLNPAYRDPEAAKSYGHPDVIAPPTFPIVVTLDGAAPAIGDPELGIDYSRVVHGEQRFVYARPVRPGDRLITTASIESARSVAGNDILGLRCDVATEDGEHVVTAHMMIVARGKEEG
jgi:acyl dehydratase